MNFIAATVELRSIISDPINAYGLDYRGADAVIPAGSGDKTRSNCESSVTTGPVPNLTAFLEWKKGNSSTDHWLPRVFRRHCTAIGS